MNDKVCLMLVTDPNRDFDQEPARAGEIVLPDDRIVTIHRDRDTALRDMRATYDPTGYYEEQGSGSLMNYKALEGFEFDFIEIPV